MQIHPIDSIFYELTHSKVLSHKQRDEIVSKTIDFKIGEEFYKKIKGTIKEDTTFDELSEILEKIEIEKYGEKNKMNRNVDKKIFRFVEKDAWGISCDKDILIIDSKKENVILNAEYIGTLAFSIDYEDILKIKKILEERKYIFRIKKAQSPLMLDGSKHCVSFWNNGFVNEIETDNLDKWDVNNCSYRNTKYLLKVIDEISEVLRKYSIKLF